MTKQRARQRQRPEVPDGLDPSGVQGIAVTGILVARDGRIGRGGLVVPAPLVTRVDGPAGRYEGAAGPMPGVPLSLSRLTVVRLCRAKGGSPGQARAAP